MDQSQCVPVFRLSLCASFNPLRGGSTGPVIELSGQNFGFSIWNSAEFLVKKISGVQAREIDNRVLFELKGVQAQFESGREILRLSESSKVPLQ